MTVLNCLIDNKLMERLQLFRNGVLIIRLGLIIAFIAFAFFNKPSQLLAATAPLDSTDTSDILLQTDGAVTYTKNLFVSSAFAWEQISGDCVPASTEMMLNFILKKGTKSYGFIWSFNATYDRLLTIKSWEKSHDTLPSGNGTDPNGWRNGLNHYGWGSYTDPSLMTYKVKAYDTYGSAVRGAIQAIAKYNKPVGILGHAGSHAQVLNGYEIYGQNPTTSTDFKINYVYLTDPLKSDNILNKKISNYNFHYGDLVYRFRAYKWTDSTVDDPYTSGSYVASNDWYGKWVIIAPVR